MCNVKLYDGSTVCRDCNNVKKIIAVRNTAIARWKLWVKRIKIISDKSHPSTKIDANVTVPAIAWVGKAKDVLRNEIYVVWVKIKIMCTN